MQLANTIALFTLSASLFGLIIAIWIHRKQLNAQAFIAYTEKYDSLVEKMPDYWHHRYEKQYVFPDSDEVSRQKFRAYFHLCSQEFYLYIKGLVARDVWLIWVREIEKNLYTKLLVREWSKLDDEFKSYTEFYSYVKEVQELGPGNNSAEKYNKANALERLKAVFVPHTAFKRR